ncbi:MAG: 30S ribosomal protein S4 [archaeon]
MGDPRRQHKRYEKPKKKFEAARMKEEDLLIQKYGLKNKKEIWRSEFKIDNIRRQAKSLIRSPQQAEKLVLKLKNLGLKVNAVDDILALTRENILERRLQTVLVRKGLAKTFREARQLITHKHVLVGSNIVNIPSFIVPLSMEDKIKISKKQISKKKAQETSEIVTENTGGENE